MFNCHQIERAYSMEGLKIDNSQKALSIMTSLREEVPHIWV